MLRLTKLSLPILLNRGTKSIGMDKPILISLLTGAMPFLSSLALRSVCLSPIFVAAIGYRFI
jgi:hypothetical protein